MDFLRGLGSGAEVGARASGELGVPRAFTVPPNHTCRIDFAWFSWGIHKEAFQFLFFQSDISAKNGGFYSQNPGKPVLFFNHL